MKIWLPAPVYKLKPFLLLLLAVMSFLIFKNKFILAASAALLCYGVYILVIRFMWADSSNTNLF